MLTIIGGIKKGFLTYRVMELIAAQVKLAKELVKKTDLTQWKRTGLYNNEARACIENLLTFESRCPACGKVIHHMDWDGEVFHHVCRNKKCQYDSSLYKIFPFSDLHQYQLAKELSNVYHR